MTTSADTTTCPLEGQTATRGQPTTGLCGQTETRTSNLGVCQLTVIHESVQHLQSTFRGPRLHSAGEVTEKKTPPLKKRAADREGATGTGGQPQLSRREGQGGPWLCVSSSSAPTEVSDTGDTTTHIPELLLVSAGTMGYKSRSLGPSRGIGL